MERLVSITIEIKPHDLLESFRAYYGRRFYWEQPLNDLALCALGNVRHFDGPLEDLATQVDELARNAVVLGQTLSPSAPLLLGAFPFPAVATLASAWAVLPTGLTVPELSIRRQAGRAWLTFNQFARRAEEIVEPAGLEDLFVGRGEQANAESAREITSGTRETPDRAAWDRLVMDALAEIGAGNLEKVVVAREVDVALPGELDVVECLDCLRSAYPETTVFALGDGRSTFLGSTPERLASVDMRSVEVPCVAGSAARGNDEHQDSERADSLLHDDKNLREHEAVRRFVLEELGRLADNVVIDPEPSILTVRNIHHLASLASGELRPGVGILDVVGALHPTPAVAGLPRGRAIDFIRTHESFDRGLYSGTIGWLNLEGEGDFAVALRSAVIENEKAVAHLFAGSGIVADSDPAAEWQETAIKLQPMLSALGAA